jgi:glutamyl-tRNA synthetase
MANIVDDHLMKITHVLRAQEWIPSTPNHVLLYKAFGWDPPQFCHLPMVMGEDGKKLSKRHGATQVKDFKTKGYLAEAIINFIVLLGWAYDDKEELFSMDRLKEVFDINKINKSPAVFNYSKLNWFNGVYIRELNNDKLLELVLPYYIEKELINKEPTGEEIAGLKKIIPLIKERIEVLADAPDMSYFMFGELCEYVTWEKIIPKKTEKETVIKILTDSKDILINLGSENPDDLKQKLYDLTQKHNVKAGAIFMPVRIAVTGTNRSPDLMPVLEALGADRVLKRIDNAINKLKEEL